MLTAGLRLALVPLVPLAAALLAHEWRRHRVGPQVVALGGTAGCLALALSVAGAVSGGASLERSFGVAIAGVVLTVRADSASIAVVCIACLASLLTLARRPGGRHALGLLVCLAGTATAAVAGNLVLITAGVQLVGAGVLLSGIRGRHLERTAVVLCVLVQCAALALLAAAGQLLAAASSTDPAFIPAGAVGGAVAVPWALAASALLGAPLLAGRAHAGRGWTVCGVLPVGYLALLRLQQVSGGQLPGNASLALSAAGAAVALAGALVALRSHAVGAAPTGAAAVLVGILLCSAATDPARTGAATAGLFFTVELGLLAAGAWQVRNSAWSSASAALLCLPGGAGFAVAVLGLGSVADRGIPASAELGSLLLATCLVAMAAARRLASTRVHWRPASLAVAVSLVLGLAGGLVPGAAATAVVAPLAPGAGGVDVDAGALRGPGASWPGGYLASAALVLLAAVASALVVRDGTGVGEPAAMSLRAGQPDLRTLLRARRLFTGPLRSACGGALRLDRWLEAQPQPGLLLVLAVVGVIFLRG